MDVLTALIQVSFTVTNIRSTFDVYTFYTQQKLADVLVVVGRRVIGLTQANILVLLAVLSLQLLRLMLWQLLEGGHYQLKDTRILTAIFSLHTVMCSAPCSSVFTAATHEVIPTHCG